MSSRLSPKWEQTFLYRLWPNIRLRASFFWHLTHLREVVNGHNLVIFCNKLSGKFKLIFHVLMRLVRYRVFMCLIPGFWLTKSKSIMKPNSTVIKSWSLENGIYHRSTSNSYQSIKRLTKSNSKHVFCAFNANCLWKFNEILITQHFFSVFACIRLKI